jgi:hypothetical protein
MITFETTINGEQVIRPPTGIALPEGVVEITVKRIGRVESVSREVANQHMRQSRIATGRPTGIDNEAIDADLARHFEGDD